MRSNIMLVNERLEKTNTAMNIPAWIDLPTDLWAIALSFLAFNDLAHVRVVNRPMNTSAYLAGFFSQLSLHSQITQEITLGKYLLLNVESEQEQIGASRISLYFQQRYNENHVNLLTEYNVALSQLLGDHQSMWVACREEIDKKFYPEVTQEWLQLECKSLISLAKEMSSTYQIIFPNYNHGIFINSNVSIHEQMIGRDQGAINLPPKLALMSYSKLLEFFDRINFIEQVWADVTLLYAIFGGVEFPALTNVDQRILDLFDNPVITENITSLPLVFISNLEPHNFDIDLLIRNSVLFSYLNSLSSDELIFVIKHVSTIGGLDLSFLEAIIRSPEMRGRLLSADYTKMAAYLAEKSQKESVDPEKAAVILSIPEIIEHLLDEDLLELMSKLWEEIPQLLLNNMKLKNRMTGDLWFELVEKSCIFAGVVSQDKEIYDLFSAQQLKYLVQEKFQKNLLDDEDVFVKLNEIFTVREIKVLSFNARSSFVERISMLIPKNAGIFNSNSSVSYSVLPGHDPMIMNRGIRNSRVLEVKTLPLENNPQHNRSNLGKSNDLENAMEYVFAGANILLLMGAATGIATFLLPQMLSMAIGFLGAALLAFSAYGLMANSRYGFFSTSDSSTIASSSLHKIDLNKEICNHSGKTKV
jgi:hypothetical protein